MSRNRNRDRGRIEGQWAASRYEVLDSPAWKATSFGARALYIALVRQLSYSRLNNGKVFLSTRDAAEELGARQMSIGRWYRELEHYGFIVMTSAGHLGVEGKGRAANWRLTDWAWGNGCERTRDYLKWDGVLFQGPHHQNHPPSKTRPPKTESRSTPRFRVKHTPLHAPEAHPASGPPKSEAHPASYGGGYPDSAGLELGADRAGDCRDCRWSGPEKEDPFDGGWGEG
jgi:hypothetical protein